MANTSGVNFNLEKTIKRMEEKLSNLYRLQLEQGSVSKEVSDKMTWINVNLLSELTGWRRPDLIKARKNKLVQYRNVEDKVNVFEYLLESIHPMFLKQTYVERLLANNERNGTGAKLCGTIFNS